MNRIIHEIVAPDRVTGIMDVVPQIKKTKELWQREGLQTLGNMIIAERNGKVMWVVQMYSADRDDALKICLMVFQGMRPDAITLVSEAYCKQVLQENFDPNAPRERFQDEVNAGRRGDIRDCLMCVRRDRAGTFQTVSLPFEQFEDSVVYWGPEEFKDLKGVEFKGFIPDCLNKIFAMRAVADVANDIWGSDDGPSMRQREYIAAKQTVKFIAAKMDCDFSLDLTEELRDANDEEATG